GERPLGRAADDRVHRRGGETQPIRVVVAPEAVDAVGVGERNAPRHDRHAHDLPGRQIPRVAVVDRARRETEVLEVDHDRLRRAGDRQAQRPRHPQSDQRRPPHRH
ncbi:MAG: hypothetical protein ACK56I_23075, partial [bacterium]